MTWLRRAFQHRTDLPTWIYLLMLAALVNMTFNNIIRSYKEFAHERRIAHCVHAKLIRCPIDDKTTVILRYADQRDTV